MSAVYIKDHSLNSNEIERYSRQLITPDIGVQGQMKLCASRVLVVGAGGLGCPVALYLATAGVSVLGIVDYDTVEISNLHRQIGHQESSTGVPKAVSLANTIKSINSLVTVNTYETTFTSETAMDIIKNYDIVVDASDNVATRYLINDACVLSKKPLVSGSALKWEGQVTVYNYENGPCYRCIFPTPPPVDTVTKCSDGGVLGPIVGVIGSLQALETIKIITNNKEGVLSGRLLIYDGMSAVFRTVRIRGRQPHCSVCGDNPTVTQLIDYTEFCRSNYSEAAGKVDDRVEHHNIITVQQYNEVIKSNKNHLLIDVRPSNQFEICSLPNSENIPIEVIDKQESIDKIEKLINDKINSNEDSELSVYLLCRRGNKSQDAIKILDEKLKISRDKVKIQHIKDGLLGWNESIDSSFPYY
ncbi:hypothetical protein DICPUDRAFT_147648 [Dictyostelium purpureum]|uniref:Adenylyltransferase and sulfurtransferase MOCS3 homolog n=1 Tax=Dictyostelium purpureum TaxID=5786 RepID=F0Z915_DICPU|nr:uncharacterized protein DICPUDRAFT_147648 [Dictyostelium purpureum]EGC39582.1 hypothetical protein DICPUDRAFT_147648 [Dictyostelium purpureum]|eukprot:XP_003283917.1 hypothetical protein DICPUDRAFT_147648 [Dictyostelium purpureum]